MESIIMLAGMAVVGLLYWAMERLHTPPTPTLPRVRKAALELMDGLDPKHILELGSGWGGMIKKLQRRFPGARIDGYEKSILPYIVSRLRGHPVHRSDLFQAYMSSADIIFCYLVPWHLEQLEPIFTKSLKPGAVVITASYALPNRKPDDKRIVKGIVDIPVYLYRF